MDRQDSITGSSDIVRGADRSLLTSHKGIPDALRLAYAGRVSEILDDDAMRRELDEIIPSDVNGTVDANRLMGRRFRTIAEQLAFTVLFKRRIADLCGDSGYRILRCDADAVDLSGFDRVQYVTYEFMEKTKVMPHTFTEENLEHALRRHGFETDAGAIKGLYTALSIVFEKGSKEAEIEHDHPESDRFIISLGRGRFNSRHAPGGMERLDRGTVVAMKENLDHNFAAFDDEDWTALSFHVPYRGIGEDAIRFHAATK